MVSKRFHFLTNIAVSSPLHILRTVALSFAYMSNPGYIVSKKKKNCRKNSYILTISPILPPLCRSNPGRILPKQKKLCKEWMSSLFSLFLPFYLLSHIHIWGKFLCAQGLLLVKQGYGGNIWYQNWTQISALPPIIFLWPNTHI